MNVCVWGGTNVTINCVPQSHNALRHDNMTLNAHLQQLKHYNHQERADSAEIRFVYFVFGLRTAYDYLDLKFKHRHQTTYAAE